MNSEQPAPSDTELARQTQAGSLAAFEQLVCRHENRLYRFLCQSCRNEADAQELAQETFLAAFRSIRRFDPKFPFLTWLFTIARRKFIDHRRTRRPEPIGAVPEQEDHQDPSVIAAERESAAGVWKLARHFLPDNQFQALWLRYQEDMSVKEVARTLRLSQVHVKVLLFRARQTLLRTLPNPAQHPQPNIPAAPSRPHEKASRPTAFPADFAMLQPEPRRK